MGKHPNSNPCSCPETGAWLYGLCSPWKQCWFMCHWCKRADAFAISIPTWLKKEEPPLYDQTIAGRLNLFKEIICRLNRMHWKRIDNSSVGGYGLCLQWRQCWFEFRSCKGHCQPSSPVKHVLSHQESRCICYQYFLHAGERTTISLWHNKDRQAELISKRSTKCRPNFTECLHSALPDLFKAFI